VKISIPENFTERPPNMEPFLVPEFVKKMNEFISRAKQLKTSIPNVLGEYKTLGIVGIGGSQVQPLVFEPLSSIPTTHLEVPDPYILNNFLNQDIKNTRVIYCSRSGMTNEVLSFIPFLMDFDSLVVSNGGTLLEVANQFGWSIVSVTHDISGRFAIQNELGIVPMIAMGLNPEEFLTNLKKSYGKYFKKGSQAEETALKIWNLEQLGISKAKILPSGQFTHGLGILLTQLLNESVPKHPTDTLDTSLHLMPRSAHSDLQRWYGGVNDSFLFSILCSDYNNDLVEEDFPKSLRKSVPGIKGKAGQHLNITSQAVGDTFPGPVFQIDLEKNTIAETAQCVGFLHAVTVRLCQLKGSNPFDQPAVQQYKDRASQIYQKLQ
jgi:glucose-6-phosphate isomerase